jgi:hypothetical protein
MRTFQTMAEHNPTEIAHKGILIRVLDADTDKAYQIKDNSIVLCKPAKQFKLAFKALKEDLDVTVYMQGSSTSTGKFRVTPVSGWTIFEHGGDQATWVTLDSSTEEAHSVGITEGKVENGLIRFVVEKGRKRSKEVQHLISKGIKARGNDGRRGGFSFGSEGPVPMGLGELKSLGGPSDGFERAERSRVPAFGSSSRGQGSAGESAGLFGAIPKDRESARYDPYPMKSQGQRFTDVGIAHGQDSTVKYNTVKGLDVDRSRTLDFTVRMVADAEAEKPRFRPILGTVPATANQLNREFTMK